MINKYLRHFNIKFYKTKEWKEKRQEILKRDNNECQECKKRGRYSKASVVHHIKFYQHNPELALTNSNLITVCSDCHNKLHPEKSFKSKNKTIHAERWE